MSPLQKAILEATPEEIAEVLSPFQPYGVKTFNDLVWEFNEREIFKQSRLKIEEEQRTIAEREVARKSAVQELVAAGVKKEMLGEKPEESLIVEAVLALPEGKRQDYVRQHLLPTNLPSGQKDSSKNVLGLKFAEEQGKTEKLAESEVAEITATFPNTAKKEAVVA